MNQLPSVSCVMPCGYGDKYVDIAVQCFFNQTCQGLLELVIVDNNDSDFQFGIIIPEGLDESRICVTYVRCDREPVGALRNIGTENASGEICITWDEDDWYHPDRVSSQVERLLTTGKAVTGWHNILFFNEADGRAYKYFYSRDSNHPPYACGTSQCYLKSWWERHRFPDTGIEDFPFTREALHAEQLDSTDAGQLCVARAHKDSKCPPQFGHRQFPEVEITALPKEFLEAIKFTRGITNE